MVVEIQGIRPQTLLNIVETSEWMPSSQHDTTLDFQQLLIALKEMFKQQQENDNDARDTRGSTNGSTGRNVRNDVGRSTTADLRNTATVLLSHDHHHQQQQQQPSEQQSIPEVSLARLQLSAFVAGNDEAEVRRQSGGQYTVDSDSKDILTPTKLTKILEEVETMIDEVVKDEETT